MAYVKRFEVIGTKLVFYMSDCTTQEIDLCVECPQVPIEDDPGDWPNPEPSEDVRCRVATHVGLLAANRLNNFLSGLNLDTQGLNILGAYATGKIAEYGWPITMYAGLTAFAQSLFTGGGAGAGKAAKIDWDAGNAEDILASQEALYCSITETGEVDEPQRAQWAFLMESGGDFESLLAQFVGLWPLASLRADVYAASINEAAVDCEAFDCITLSDCTPGTIVTTLYGAGLSGWSTGLIAYGIPARDSRSFHTGEITFALPSALCITKVRVSHAGQSGSAWQKIQLLINGVPYPVQNSKGDIYCNTDNLDSNYWILPEPVLGTAVQFVGSDMASGVSGNAAVPHVIHCIHVDHG